VRQSSEVVTLAENRPAKVVIGSKQAALFRRLADEHLDAAYRLARAILRDEAEAEDATHDAFVQAWRKWTTLRDETRFAQWFDRILVNTCRNRLNRSRRLQAKDISGELGLATRDQFGPADDRDAIGAAIASLSPDHRLVVALRYYLDLTVDDIARRLGIPAGTVQSRLHYAHQRLHAALEPVDLKGTSND
jgi:RNA polymerase sigma-70 factor (ECF subfamily)